MGKFPCLQAANEQATLEAINQEVSSRQLELGELLDTIAKRHSLLASLDTQVDSEIEIKRQAIQVQIIWCGNKCYEENILINFLSIISISMYQMLLSYSFIA